ncbi:hypothetical protein [Paenibacillus sp. F4]|uniref:hypothetical protein n=1 Tax=Paenibacillus sp. F4 TaxID=357385 RepID=UPI0021558D72|nr:hypothetical protein [Paenibacillus sp. F4]
MMNFFGKKKKQQDAIEQADQLMNKGLSGLFMKGLVPEEHREQIWRYGGSGEQSGKFIGTDLYGSGDSVNE